MSFFTSEFECKIDAKGRLVLPARIKVNLPEVPGQSGNELVLRMGFEPNLILYPMGEFKKIHNKISSLNEFQPENRALKRNFFRSIAQVEMDSAGRILIPKNFMKYASLDKEATVVGVGTTIEIWDPGVYEKHLINDPQEYSQLAQKLLDE
jgi:MraZ protein